MTAINRAKKTIILAIIVLGIGITSFTLLGIIISMGGPEPLRPATYPNGAGFQNAMIWFELAASKEEVFQILADPRDETGIRFRQIMDKINNFDYYYMVSYSLFCVFVAAFMFYLNQKNPTAAAAKKWILFPAIIVSLVMLIGDAMENAQLLQLTKYASLDAIEDTVVTALNTWTRVKWGAIFIFAMLISFAYFTYFRDKKLPQILFVLAYGSAAVTGMVSLSAVKMRFLVEPASYLIALSWLLSIIHAGIVLKTNARS